MSAPRICGPSTWVVEATGRIEITMGCRDCGAEWAWEDVAEEAVHARLGLARALFKAHECKTHPKPEGLPS